MESKIAMVGDKLIKPMILLMVQKSSDHHLGYKKNPVLGGPPSSYKWGYNSYK